MTQVTSKWVDETTRIVVDYDEDAQNPLTDWCHGTSVYGPDIESHGNATLHEELDTLARIAGTQSAFVESAGVFLGIMGVAHHIESARGYPVVWYADSHTLGSGRTCTCNEGLTNEMVEDVARTYSAYEDGENYVAHRQEKCSRGDWHTVDSIGLGTWPDADDDDELLYEAEAAL